MKPGDLVVPNNTPDGNPMGFAKRYVYLGNELQWHDFVGMTGERVDFSRDMVGVLLESREITGTFASHGKVRTFWKVLMSTGQTGWAHENWLEVIDETVQTPI